MGSVRPPDNWEVGITTPRPDGETEARTHLYVGLGPDSTARALSLLPPKYQFTWMNCLAPYI